MLPCAADSPNVELDVMDDLLKKAVAAFPVALSIGKKIEDLVAADLYLIRDKFELAVGHRLDDSRLTTHYALIIACAIEVIQYSAQKFDIQAFIFRLCIILTKHVVKMRQCGIISKAL